MGRKAWLFSGSELVGQRAAIVMSLLQPAKLNEHDPHAWQGRARARALSSGKPDQRPVAASLSAELKAHDPAQARAAVNGGGVTRLHRVSCAEIRKMGCQVAPRKLQ
jgi:hypothetical protein